MGRAEHQHFFVSAPAAWMTSTHLEQQRENQPHQGWWCWLRTGNSPEEDVWSNKRLFTHTDSIVWIHTLAPPILLPQRVWRSSRRRMTALRLSALLPRNSFPWVHGEKQSTPHAGAGNGSSPSRCQLMEQGTRLAEQELVGSGFANAVVKPPKFPHYFVLLVCSHIMALALFWGKEAEKNPRDLWWAALLPKFWYDVDNSQCGQSWRCGASFLRWNLSLVSLAWFLVKPKIQTQITDYSCLGR